MSISDSMILAEYPPDTFWSPIFLRNDDSSFYYKFVPGAAPMPMALLDGMTTALNGKMDKSVYDANANGIVDAAETAPWTGITGKPTTFPPSAHSTAWSDITGIPSTFAPSAHSHVISDVTGLQTAITAKASVYGAAAQIAAPRVFVATAALVGAGSVVIYLTDTGLVGGTALFSTILRVDCGVYDSTTVYAFNPVVSNANKTLTIAVTKSSTPVLALLGINILGAPLAAPIGTSVNITVIGY